MPRPIEAPSTAQYVADSITFVLTAWLVSGLAAPLTAQFSSGVSVVEVYASVTDARGEPVSGLTQRDFDVEEDGVKQTVAAFSAGDFPLSVAIALDRSFSMAGPRLAVARSAARVFLGELRPADESAVLAIGSRVETIAPLSTDRQTQFAALARIDSFGTTGLYDSLASAIELTQPGKGRRALVVLSDGTDRYSTTTAADALETARRSDVMVYPISIGDAPSPFFEQLARLTGGRDFHARDPRQLNDILKQVARELRFQYLIGYTPAKPAGAAEWRRIAVSVRRPGVTVRAREGYVAR
jgi:Ca-activated chloride channel family protein